MSQLIHVLLSSLALALLGSVRTAAIPPARPFWCDEPCPAWCAGDHALEGEHVGTVRTHTSAADGREVDAQLRQEPGAGVRLALAVTVEAGHCEAAETELDLETAERLALDLLILARLARIGREVDA